MDQLIDVIVIGKQFQEKNLPLYIMNTEVKPIFRFLTFHNKLHLNATVTNYQHTIEPMKIEKELSLTEQLQVLISKVQNPFIIIFDDKIDVCLTNLEKLDDIMREDVGAISGVALGSIIPEVMFPIITSTTKNLKENFMVSCQKYSTYTHMCEKVIIEIQYGNYQLCLFHPQIVEQDVFNFEKYTRVDELLVDSFYRIKENGLKNYVFGGAFSYLANDKNVYEKQFSKVFELWTGKYLSYPKPFYASKDTLKPLVKQWKILEAHNQKINDKNILFIVPSDVFVNGLNVHVQDLIGKIRDVNFYCLMPSFSNNEIKYFDFVQYLNGIEIERYKIPYVAETHISVMESEEYQEMLKIIIESYSIDIIHIHIMALGHTLDAPKIAKKLGKKVFLSLHDLYYLSGDFTQKDISIPYNSQVLSEKYSIQNAKAFYQKWHDSVQEMLNHVDLVIGFSQSTISIYQKWYQLKAYEIIPHGYNYTKRYKLTNQNIEGTKIKCVYYGRVEEEKGSDLLYELAKLLPEIEFHILGVIADKRFEKESKLPKNITVYGKYQKEKLPKILQKINPHFVILPSTWHETFAYTLTEAYLYGLIPIVTPFGALKERVENSGVGFVAEQANAASLAKVIKQSAQMSNIEWQILLEEVDKVHLTTIDEMIKAYEKNYDLQVLEVKKQTRQEYMDQQYTQSENAKRTLYSCRIDERINNFDYYYNQTFKLAQIDNSRGLKMLRKIWDFRNQRKIRD